MDKSKGISTRFSFFKILAVLFVAFISSQLFAQSEAQRGSNRLSVNLSNPGRPALVRANLLSGSITVTGYEGRDVIVEARTRQQSSPSEGGLQRLPIPPILSVKEENNVVRINTGTYVRSVDLFISVPVDTSLKLRVVQGGDIVVRGVDGDFDITDLNGSVVLNGVSGTVVADALKGNVVATLTRVNAQKPMAFSSLTGDVDVTFPADLKANVSIRSDRGEVFSAFDIQLDAAISKRIEGGGEHGNDYRLNTGKIVRGKINGGGAEIHLTDFFGRIYLRKPK